ncbi:MAG TPA: Gfo/Idh/MocA family oxidoreductase [Chthonomonadales bacterium]|nr:Gfo/Idh/MocA family oxidoreductase [Chthonomonadales bacterium]
MARKARKPDRVRVAIVGVGIGSTHARGYARCGRAEIVALCDLDTNRAQRLAAQFGVKRIYSDYQIMLAEEKLDAVSVCTPNALHEPVAVAALEAGCHVLCEKPLATNGESARRILEAVRRARRCFMLGMNNRFRGDTQVLKAYVDSGDLGSIYYARCGWVRRKGIPGMGGWFTRKEVAGGGPLIDIGVHAFDLTWYLMGNPKPVAAFGATYAQFGPRGFGGGGWGTAVAGGSFDVEDLAAAQVRFGNGATLCLEASWAQHCQGERLYSEVYGDAGGATLEPLRVFADHRGRPVDIAPHVPQVDGHEAEVAHFVDCVLTDRQPSSTIEQGWEVMKVLDAIYESSRTGASVAIG